MRGAQDIVQLPHQHIAHFEGNDLKLAIERNFREVANMLHTLQIYEKRTGKPINETVANIVNIDGKVITGMLADKMVGLLNELQLADEAVTTDKIAAEAVTADKIYVNELSAISAYLGTVLAGEIYGTTIRSGQPEDEDYIELSSGWEPLKVVQDNEISLSVWSNNGEGFIQIYKSGDMVGQILPMDDAEGKGLRIQARGDSIGYENLSLNALKEIYISSGASYDVTIDTNKLWVTGDLRVFGIDKNSVMFTSNYGQRLLYSYEMPEPKFMDEGTGQLVDGICRIDLDPIFLETIEPNTPETPFIVHLTPYDWLNLRVKEIGDTYFVVEEKDGLSGEFSWQLSAIKRGGSRRRLECVNDDDPVLTSNWEDEINGR